MQACRRRFLRHAGAAGLATVPLSWVALPAAARSNASLRTQLKYQATPFEDKSCSQCLEFLPGDGNASTGGCKVIPDDDEIAASGWCTLWNTL